jgi:LuxR family maltose regulon positive regulatory protein
MLGDLQSASKVMHEALTVAEAHGFLRTILDDGQELQPVLQLALQQNVAPPYITRLLNMISVPEPDSGSQARANRLLIEPLSDRELEVLSLVADGLSNQQIAEKLFVALSTVKKHMGAIFGKLNVSSRTEAIQRARSLGLI